MDFSFLVICSLRRDLSRKCLGQEEILKRLQAPKLEYARNSEDLFHEIFGEGNAFFSGRLAGLLDKGGSAASEI
jgi:hypothetical protein